MGWLSEFRTEWKARKEGAKNVPKGLGRAAREITGGIGAGTSSAWKHVDQDGQAYLDSFDRKLPPSLHISERDRVRAGMPIPVAERCLEDLGQANREKAERLNSAPPSTD